MWHDHEWFPSSLCSWESIPTIAATAGAAAAAPETGGTSLIPVIAGGVGAASTIAGTVLKARGASEEAQSQAAALQAKAAADRVQANTEAGYYQRQALADRRKTDLALSRGQAIAAAQGGNATDPSTVSLQQSIAGQGEYNALSQLAAGQTRESALNYQSDIDLFNARRYRNAVAPAVIGTYASGLGTLASSPLFRPSRFGGLFDYGYGGYGGGTP